MLDKKAVREVSTAPTTLPSIIATKNAMALDLDNYRRTAPASLVTEDRFKTPTIAPSTQKQNAKLSMLLNLLNKYGSERHGGADSSLGRSDENQAALAQQFDKNWMEIMKLIGILKFMRNG
jgi:hypothetical protein